MNFVNCGVNTSISNYCFKKVSFFLNFHNFVFIFEKIDQTFIDIILIFLHIFKSYLYKKTKYIKRGFLVLHIYIYAEQVHIFTFTCIMNVHMKMQYRSLSQTVKDAHLFWL